jgi:hypothetical protein
MKFLVKFDHEQSSEDQVPTAGPPYGGRKQTPELAVKGM